MHGANLYKESLLGIDNSRSTKSSRRQSQIEFFNSNQSSSTKPVESILVCTGVYNPQNDMLYHLKNIFDKSLNFGQTNETNNNNESVGSETCDGLTLVVPDNKLVKKESCGNFLDIETLELRNALSRKNSFISYFDNKLNIPDITVDNLMDAVYYIVESSGKYDQ